MSEMNSPFHLVPRHCTTVCVRRKIELVVRCGHITFLSESVACKNPLLISYPN